MRSVLIFLGLAGLVAGADPITFSSGTGRTHLLELYTSEGCSSCPPAEQWLGRLRDDPRLWRDFVPVAFHVVYWDKLGWRDRFARKDFTAREYACAKAWAGDSVYTPCFVLDGGEWRADAERKAPDATAGGAGMLRATYEPDGRLTVKFSAGNREAFEVHAAILGGGIVSKVAAGENDGRTLHHEFVALILQSAALREGTAVLSLAIPQVTGVTRHSLAVWVTRTGGTEPIQATGGWLD